LLLKFDRHGEVFDRRRVVLLLIESDPDKVATFGSLRKLLHPGRQCFDDRVQVAPVFEIDRFGNGLMVVVEGWQLPQSNHRQRDSDYRDTAEEIHPRTIIDRPSGSNKLAVSHSAPTFKVTRTTEYVLEGNASANRASESIRSRPRTMHLREQKSTGPH
jgi:hypothetical protein